MLIKDAKIGMVFTNKTGDKATVVGIVGWDNVTLEFEGTKSRLKTRWSHILNGSFRDKYKPCVMGVGFIGEGKHKSKSGKLHTKTYNNWYNMFVRCYSDFYAETKPTYNDCTVDPRWYNFQVFADWSLEHYPNDGLDYHLDKDIKVNGNKLYSPETCLYVTPTENAVKAHAKHWEFINPQGQRVSIYNLQEYCRDNNLLQCCMSMVHSGHYKQYIGWTKFIL